MGHAHSSGGHNQSDSSRRMTVVLILTGLYMLAEVIGGLLTGSLALIADAGHMLSDFGALLLSLFAIRIAQRPADPRRTYGYYRAEVLAASLNGLSLVAIAVFIFIEAFERFESPPEVEGGLMLLIACGGLLVNLIGLIVLHGGRSESLNVRGAWLHVLTDALGSVGAILGGLLIWAFDWNLADPIVSILIGLLVVYSSWNLLRESTNILMQTTPPHIDLEEIETALAEVPGLSQPHDLHVWTMTDRRYVLTCHITVTAGHTPGDVLRTAQTMIRDRFLIEHTTIQTEPLDFDQSTDAKPADPR